MKVSNSQFDILNCFRDNHVDYMPHFIDTSPVGMYGLYNFSSIMEGLPANPHALRNINCLLQHQNPKISYTDWASQQYSHRPFLLP